MKEISIFSININGIRAACKKGFHEWLVKTHPDIVCLQEIRAKEKDLPMKFVDLKRYHAFWFPAQKAGYSGTAILSREKPINIIYGLDIRPFDVEGRVIIAEYCDFFIINCYVPNGRPDYSRLSFKYKFYEEVLKKCIMHNKTKTVILCGDFNIAHNEIDLANPKSNSKNTGFLFEGRRYFSTFIDSSFVDIHRYFNPEKEGQFTWWNSARDFKKRNIGWRYDYFLINKKSLDKVSASLIHDNVEISDHCPISINFKVNKCNLETA